MNRFDGLGRAMPRTLQSAVLGPVWAWLVAQADGGSGRGSAMDPLHALRDHWGSDVAAPLQWVLIAGGALLMALGVVLMVRWWRGRHQRSKPWAVFQQIAGVAELGVADQWLLVRIARQQRLPTPLTLLLSGRTLRMHGRAFVETQVPWRRVAIMRRIASIRRHVFGHMDV